MLAMGRRRQTRLDLPPHMQIKHGAYYYVSRTVPRKWTRLSTDLAKARVLWAEIESSGSDDSPTMADLIYRWLASSAASKLAANTVKNYEVAAKKLREFLNGARIADITPTVIYAWLDNHDSPGNANIGRALLSNVFKASIRQGLCTSNPCKDVAALKLSKRTRYITDAEYMAIWEQADPVLRVAMDLSYLTSARISDVAKITLKDVSGDTLPVLIKKTGKPQDIEITPVLRKTIDSAKALPRSVRGMTLICNRRGQAYNLRTFDKMWSEACLLAKVTGAVFHDIRAKSATDAKALGLDYQKMLGHSTKAMSERYVRLREVDRITPLPRQVGR